MSDEPTEIAWQGKWITAKRQGRWEFVSRARGIRAVVIVAVDDGHVLLVDQYRVPLGRRCLELPAGLVGDEDANDTIEGAARRELEEETGYRCASVEALGDYYSSPGLVSEGFTLVRVSGLTRIGQGGGTADEDIIVHRVALTELPEFVAAKREEGLAIDVKLLLLLAQSLLA
ncbi:NUDIX hydrolase [Sphingomonas sp. JC676]|uniref:NUDIX hydrolase n=1 Tax=Sphingomonas sp. JC676 TaxID=2768065 RepID=UPI00165786B5|nr:NUDIX hydrolase [Sphingomonas sp. JC676]MBC9033302.1 NUDIX hydrolase [Sphingomonas sp. JC676]